MRCRLKLGQFMHIHTGTLSGNYHGPDHAPLRNTAQVVRMSSYAHMWTIYLYRSDGRAHQLMVAFPRWRGSWPKSCERKEPPHD